MSWIDTVAAATAAVELVMNGVLVADLWCGNLGSWPPPTDRRWYRAWQFWFVYSTFLLSVAGFVIVGWFTERVVWTPSPVRTVAAWCLIVGGLGLTAWGMVHLTLRQSLGEIDHLVRTGPYCFTRNPQYVGDGVAVVGAVLWRPSFGTMILGGMLIFWLALVPLLEEPALSEAFGAEYEAYRQTVPRYIGW